MGVGHTHNGSPQSKAEVIPPVIVPPPASMVADEPLAAERFAVVLGSRLRALLLPVLGFSLFVALWSIVAHSSDLPGPMPTWNSALKLFSNPFYKHSSNDQSIGWNILQSLSRVGMGFRLVAVVVIPLGLLAGRFAFLNQLSPIASRLQPITPSRGFPSGCTSSIKRRR